MFYIKFIMQAYLLQVHLVVIPGQKPLHDFRLETTKPDRGGDDLSITAQNPHLLAQI